MRSISTNNIVPSKGKRQPEKKEEEKMRKTRDPNKARNITTTRPVGLPTTGKGGRVRMGDVNTMVPGWVLQQNTAIGKQSVVPRKEMQNRPSPPGVVGFQKVTNVMKTGRSDVSYVTPPQELAKISSRTKVAFSGVLLIEIGINARQLEAVLTGQPGADYQGVISALATRRQQEQILMRQTGRTSSNVDYQDLIDQVCKMQDTANNKIHSTTAVNRGMQMGYSTNEIRYGTGEMSQGARTQRNATPQQQILMKQKKPTQVQISTGQRQAGLQTRTTRVANQAMKVQSAGMRPDIARKGETGKKGQQITHPGMTVTPGNKKREKVKALPMALQGKKKAGQKTRPTLATTPLKIGNKKHAGPAGVKTAARAGRAQQQRVQQTGAVAHGRGVPQASQRGGDQHQLGHAAHGQLPGQVNIQGGCNENHDFYPIPTQQLEDDVNDNGVNVHIDATVYQEDNNEDGNDEAVDDEGVDEADGEIVDDEEGGDGPEDFELKKAWRAVKTRERKILKTSLRAT